MNENIEEIIYTNIGKSLSLIRHSLKGGFSRCSMSGEVHFAPFGDKPTYEMSKMRMWIDMMYPLFVAFYKDFDPNVKIKADYKKNYVIFDLRAVDSNNEKYND